MGLFEDRTGGAYDAAADKLVAAKGDMSKLNSHERDLVGRLTRETGARGNKVRNALGL